MDTAKNINCQKNKKDRRGFDVRVNPAQCGGGACGMGRGMWCQGGACRIRNEGVEPARDDFSVNSAHITKNISNFFSFPVVLCVVCFCLFCSAHEGKSTLKHQIRYRFCSTFSQEVTGFTAEKLQL